jgi:hypothetical protein
MSLESSVSIMSGTATKRLLPIVEAWAREQERAGNFAMVTEAGMAVDAEVIVGCVNYLDVEKLKALIRESVKVDGWNLWDPVGLTTHMHDAGSKPVFSLLDEDGEWKP